MKYNKLIGDKMTIYFDVCYNKEKYKQYKKQKYKNFYLIYVNDERKNYKLRLIKKLKNKLRKIKEKNIIFSKEIKEILNEYYEVKEIEENKENKKIYKDNITQIINNVILLKNHNPKEENIYILIKSNSLENYQKIENMINSYKTINIITPIIKNFRKLEEKLEEESELISVLNNKRKSLLKAEYILNIDFSEEDISRYNINRRSIIFNISNNKIDNICGFDGIIINNIELISLVDEKFDLQDEYEENKMQIINRIKKNMYKIVGKNGYISNSELVRL